MNRRNRKQNSFKESAANKDINAVFINACENGDYLTASKILEAIKDFNIDITNELGKSALRLAVENEHLEVVQVLLNKSDSQKLREALLLAIYHGHTQISELILKHPKYKVLNEKKFVNESTDSFWQTPSSDDAQFSPDITPLILAAQYKRTEIVQMLLLGGNQIVKPHDYQCKCVECANRFKFDSLRHAKSRLNAYRGLASESYISLASVDPIQTAFELGHELRSLSGKEQYFKTEYLQLADQLSFYAVKLLNNVRGRDELDIILNKTGKEEEEKYDRLARLDLAIKYQEKPFVAHSNCQQKLVEIWYSGVRNITKMHYIIIYILIFLFIVFMPITSLLHILAAPTRLGKFMSLPCIKFISHTSTYMTFIGLLILQTLRIGIESPLLFSEQYPQYHHIFKTYVSNKSIRYRFTTTDFFIRQKTPTIIDYLCAIWIAGYTWSEVKNTFRLGIRQYFLSASNILKFMMNGMFLSSYGLKFYTILFVSHQLERINDAGFWNQVSSINVTDYDVQKAVYETFYWLNADRFYWNAFDPINLSEGIFSIATTFAFALVCFLVPALELVGPLQITLGKMISDVVKFIAIFMLFFVGFMFSVSTLYAYYAQPVRSAVELVDHYPKLTAGELGFGTIRSTLNTFFWATFGIETGYETVLTPNSSNLIPQSIGSFLYGAFHIATIVMLLNMLIAMMTKSYERIREASDVEWKFARSQLYMEYINEGSSLPPPLNLIPTPKGAYLLVRRVWKFIKKRKGHHLIVDDESKSHMHKYSSPRRQQSMILLHKKSNRSHLYGDDDLTYKKVMQRIIKRFLLRSQRENEKGEEGDLEQIKQDLQMVRFEMHNDLKKTKMNTLKSLSYLHDGLTIMGEELIKETRSENNFNKFCDFKSYENDLNELLGEIPTEEY